MLFDCVIEILRFASTQPEFVRTRIIRIFLIRKLSLNAALPLNIASRDTVLNTERKLSYASRYLLTHEKSLN